MAKGILIAAMDFSNVAEDEFNDWYDTEHIPERQRVPGFLVCQRWIGADNPRQSVATYDLVGMTPAPTVETAFNAWYDTEHVPALARVPGVLCARRFRTGGGNPKYVALYHLSSPGVVDGAEWKAASGSTPMPEHIRPQISDRLRLVCRSYRRAG